MAYATRNAHDTAVPADRDLGGAVRGREVRQYVIDITASALDSEVGGDVDEIIVRVNGRPWRRLNRGQAERYGLIKLY